MQRAAGRGAPIAEAEPWGADVQAPAELKEVTLEEGKAGGIAGGGAVGRAGGARRCGGEAPAPGVPVQPDSARPLERLREGLVGCAPAGALLTPAAPQRSRVLAIDVCLRRKGLGAPKDRNGYTKGSDQLGVKCDPMFSGFGFPQSLAVLASFCIARMFRKLF